MNTANDKPGTDPKPASPNAAAAAAALPASIAATAAPADTTGGTTAPNDGREEYIVTERAGPRVAGQRVKRGQPIPLNEAEARAELLAGAIVRKGEKLGDAMKPGGRRSTKPATTA